LLLGSIGALMGRESIQALKRHPEGRPRAAKRRHHPMIAALPMRWRFYRSGLYISPLAPLLLGMVVGILTMLMGVGGGFIMVPAMLYILGMNANVVVGTSLFNILFVTMMSTMVHALTTQAVDIVLAGLLLIGSVSGAQIGVRIAVSVKAEYLRLALAAIVLGVALVMLFRLGVVPDEVFTVAPI
ncbi:MAG TPA: sulfite exporter TauE/SafE family protein, partial [Paracoccaceae bacterium]|nr:sulfite exporter TauE/SafE family protein [Paracoccaceae bacterium]